MAEKYFGFADRDDIAKEFEVGTEHRWDGTFVPDKDFPTDGQILFAAYDTGDYCGDAIVLFEKDGKLYEVHGSHCSCYGLEDNWTPEETSWEAINMRPRNGEYDDPVRTYKHGDEAHKTFWDLVDSHVKKEG